MAEPLITVVVPCFNGSADLADCLRSIWDQATACEIIVVDDGSTDNSREAAQALLQDSPVPMTVVSQRNQGPAAARNAGLRLARSKHICFPDADNQYSAGFFAAAMATLAANPDAIAAFSRIEITGCPRPVEAWQREAAERSLPGNIVIRTETARLIGGFPESPAFLDRTFGGSLAFRNLLSSFGRSEFLDRPFLKYRFQNGSRFDDFLERATLQDNRTAILPRGKEDGSIERAAVEYQDSVAARMIERVSRDVQIAIVAAVNYHQLGEQFERVEGFLERIEGFALYCFARNWPTMGRTVEIGSFKGRSTCWLAAAIKDAKLAPVAAVDTFRGSPEHQLGGKYADRDIALSGTTLAAFQSNLQQFQLLDHVAVHVGTSEEAVANWKDPIRLIFIDADHSYEAVEHDFLLWNRFVSRRGLVVFHDVGFWPGVTQFYEQLLTQSQQWRQVGRYHSLGVVEKIG